jgi:hypothetical protein
MNLILRQQQSLYVLRGLKRDMGAKLMAGLRGAAFPLAIFLMATCALASEDAKARPPADRDESDALTLSGHNNEFSQMLGEMDGIAAVQQEPGQGRNAQGGAGQRGVSAVGQANSLPQGVLDLLR